MDGDGAFPFSSKMSKRTIPYLALHVLLSIVYSQVPSDHFAVAVAASLSSFPDGPRYTAVHDHQWQQQHNVTTTETRNIRMCALANELQLHYYGP